MLDNNNDDNGDDKQKLFFMTYGGQKLTMMPTGV